MNRSVPLLTVKEIRQQLPLVVYIIGDRWLTQKCYWARRYITPRLPWYKELEKDLQILEPRVGRQKLASCYRDALRNKQEIQKTIFEVHGAALLASAADSVDLHVPRGGSSRKNFDVRVKIKGRVINADSKTRKDDFPFNLPREQHRRRGVKLFAGRRETMDPNDAAELGIRRESGGLGLHHLHHIDTPESTVIRQILSKTLTQLPENSCNLVLWGHIAGHQLNLEDALYGTPILGIKKNLDTRKASFEWQRTPTGAFGTGQEGSLFSALSGVLWIRLWGFQPKFGRDYHLYLNPNSREVLAPEVVEALTNIMAKWATPTH